MMSKFEILFLLRKSLIPTILIIISIYIFFKSIMNFSFDIIIAFVLLASALFTMFFNFSSVCKIAIEKTGIKKVFILSGKTEFIPFSSIKSSRLEFIEGSATDAGQITPGFYICIFSLIGGKEFILTPEHYQNYNQLIRQISLNRSDQDNHGIS